MHPKSVTCYIFTLLSIKIYTHRPRTIIHASRTDYEPFFNITWYSYSNSEIYIIKKFYSVHKKTFIHWIKYFSKITLKIMSEMMWKSKQFERWTLRYRLQIWGFTLKKLKLGREPLCRRPRKKNFKPSNWSRQ